MKPTQVYWWKAIQLLREKYQRLRKKKKMSGTTSGSVVSGIMVSRARAGDFKPAELIKCYRTDAKRPSIFQHEIIFSRMEGNDILMLKYWLSTVIMLKLLKSVKAQIWVKIQSKKYLSKSLHTPFPNVLVSHSLWRRKWRKAGTVRKNYKRLKGQRGGKSLKNAPNVTLFM